MVVLCVSSHFDTLILLQLECVFIHIKYILIQFFLHKVKYLTILRRNIISADDSMHSDSMEDETLDINSEESVDGRVIMH